MTTGYPENPQFFILVRDSPGVMIVLFNILPDGFYL